MQNTNTTTSNATMTPEARAVIAAGNAPFNELRQALDVADAMRATYSGEDLQPALCYLAGVAEGKHRERQRRADTTDYVEAESVALEKAIVLLNDLIDFFDPLYAAVKRGEYDKALFKACDVKPAHQKAYILADILHDMDMRTDTQLTALFSDQ